MNINEALDNQAQAPAISNSPGHAGTARLLEGGSLEMQARAAADLPAAKAFLQPGTRIYVPSLAGQSAETIQRAVEAIYRHGFEPVPHVAARRVRARAELRELMSEMVAECGVRRVMLIAGDVTTPAGPYGDSLELLEDGTLGGCGLKEVGLAGYPEGHPHIDNNRQTQSTLLKAEAARAQHLVPSIVTQFCFAPQRVVEYCSEIARLDPKIKIYAGVAGPTNPVALLRFAHLCGVNASRQALSTLGLGIARLAMQTDPIKQVQGLAQYVRGRSSCKVAGIHLYSFGGLVRTAEWLHKASTEHRRRVTCD
jgi:methylenetetrahydrofolate reductase (NADPH)